MMRRAYRPEDWGVVREIYDLSKPDEMHGIVPATSVLPLDRHPDMLRLFRESQIIVAEEDEQVVGFAGFRGSTISWLFVHPAHRRKGVGSSLLEAILNSLEGKATLNVAKGNVAARELYARLGFMTECEFEGQFNGYPCDVMRLRHAPAG